MQQWEYASFDGRVDKMDRFVSRLNEYGDEGWELVELVVNPHGLGGEKVRTAIFKRLRA